jgi:uncharacterized protein RhaS with RHS repeats
MDEGNGLLYMRARYYDPEIGRFISKDPIGLAGGINQYVYSGQNPMNRIDPEGEGPIAIGICVGLTIYDVASTIYELEDLNKKINAIDNKIKAINENCNKDVDEQLDAIGDLLVQRQLLLKERTKSLAMGSAIGIPIAYFCYASPSLPF